MLFFLYQNRERIHPPADLCHWSVCMYLYIHVPSNTSLWLSAHWQNVTTCTLSIDSDCSIYSQLVLLFTLLLIWFCTIFTIDIRSIYFNGCLTNSQFTTISLTHPFLFCSVLSHIFLSLVFPNQLFFCFTFK